jgi:hypothetical protein
MEEAKSQEMPDLERPDCAAPRLLVGQRLWLVLRRPFGGDCYATIAKVGRTWAYIDSNRGFRVQIGTLRVFSQELGVDVGQAYLTREEYGAVVDRNAAWDRLRRYFHTTSVHAPSEITIDDMQAVARLLRIKEGETT